MKSYIVSHLRNLYPTPASAYIINTMSDFGSSFIDQQNQYDFYQSIWNLHSNQSPFHYLSDDPHMLPPLTLQLQNEVKSTYNVDSEPQQAEQHLQIEEIDSGGGEKRVNNTVFKTSLSQFRKSLIDVVKSCSAFQALKQDIQAVCVTKNQSVFPRLLAMVRALQIQDEVISRWRVRKLKVIERKRRLHEAGKYSQRRLRGLQKTIRMMDQSLEQSNLQLSFNIYWGKYRQHQKYEKCKAEVIQYDVGFRNQTKIQVSLKSLKLEFQRVKRKAAKKSKAGGRKKIGDSDWK